MGIVTGLMLLATAWPSPVPVDQVSMRIAQRTWGTPACGQPHVETSTPTAYQAAHGSGYFDRGEPLAWADETRCAIVINRTFARIEIRTAVKRCHVIVHEWGHLAGHEHSLNPRSVMFGEDLVAESREDVAGRWRWVTAGAFPPCSRALRARQPSLLRSVATARRGRTACCPGSGRSGGCRACTASR